MKLGQRTHQVFTKRNFSSFTVFILKRLVPKLNLSLTPAGAETKKKMDL